jgi:hypothetical protein
MLYFFLDLFGHSKNKKDQYCAERSYYTNQSNHTITFQRRIKIEKENIYYYQCNSNKKKNIGKNFHVVRLKDKNTKF